MTEHEKRIREALEALPAIAKWSSDDLGVWMVDDPFDTFVCAAEDAQEAAYIAACNPAAIRALLADLDAVRGALEEMRGRVVELCQTYGNPLPDASLARTDAALKGATA